ncbi:NHL repeat-containing protein [Niabella ginsengisoli]|uniref:ATP/GTP-binding protein n=1 Tax=Niabella ginsengisoli TaxID=522298 RepID=A0ABS9SHC0_9BACT|nr:hypothetical protein [Niabella ginsengisoli]MCH5597758.1 hypothetical protein [Niabella ginsengisoli]
MKRLFTAFFFIILIHSVEVSNAQHTLTKTWETTDSIPVPESVLSVPNKNELYVSLIDGNGNEKDGKGGIGILNKDRSVKNLSWITGLNAPKGLGIYKNKLYVADITDVVVIDIKKGKVLKSIPITGAVFLNDITITDKGIVYVSDTREKKFMFLLMMSLSYTSTMLMALTVLKQSTTIYMYLLEKNYGSWIRTKIK